MLVITFRDSPNQGDQVVIIIVPSYGHCEVYCPLSTESQSGVIIVASYGNFEVDSALTIEAGYLVLRVSLFLSSACLHFLMGLE